MSTGNGDPSPDPTMHIDSIKFLRLLPPNKEAGPSYKYGVALFLSSAEQKRSDYCLTLSKEDARQLARDLKLFLARKIDITNPGENYGA